MDVHYEFVCLLSPSSFKVKSDGVKLSLDRLRIYSRPVRSHVTNLQGGAPGDQNHDIHLMFSGPRLQRGYRCYVTITKPRSASLHSAINICSIICVGRPRHPWYTWNIRKEGSSWSSRTERTSWTNRKYCKLTSH